MKKHILCLGDSNTHGYCADPQDCADGGNRFNEEERWTCLLQKALGDGVLVTEEGLSGRTTVFPDPLSESMDALCCIYALLKSHEEIDLLILMLGTNDVKERFCASAACIGAGMERLVRKAQSVDCWGAHAPNILLICPPSIAPAIEQTEYREGMGRGCAEKSAALPPYYKKTAQLTGAHFLDAEGCEFNQIDYMHFTRRGHAQLAERLSVLVPELLKG